MVGQNPCFHELSGVEAVDIDTEQDFEFAEDLYKKVIKIRKEDPWKGIRNNNGYIEDKEDLPY